MITVNVKDKQKTPSGWEFIVELIEVEDISKFTVQLDDDYYIDLTNRQIPPEELVRKAFIFLLRRESKHTILKSFNLRDITKYFPDFEEMIKVV